MTNVNVDVQILITGPTGSGKGLVMDRLREFLSKQVSNGITQKHSFENYFADGVTFSLDGELLQSAGPKAPKETHANIPGYPDTDKMIDYLVNKTQLSKELLNRWYDDATTPKTEPFKVIVRGLNGAMVAFREDKFLRDGDRIVTLLTATTIDAPANPVGMDQVTPQTASAQASGHDSAQPGADYTVKTQINEKGQFYCSGISTIERKPGESDADYRNRNQIPNGALIPPYVPVWASKAEIEIGAPEDHGSKRNVIFKDSIVKRLNDGESIDCGSGIVLSGAPKPDAHNKAAETYRSFSAETQALFWTNPMEGGPVYPHGLIAGNLVQVITTEGNVLIGSVKDFHWNIIPIGPVVKYYRKL